MIVQTRTFEEEVTSAPQIVAATNIRRTAQGISAEVLFADDAPDSTPYGYHFTPGDCVARSVRGYRDLDSGKLGSVMEYTEEQRLEDTMAHNSGVLNALTDTANAVCQPLAEEKDLGIISDEDLARYKAWAVYRQKLRKVDTSVESPAWPDKPE